MKRVLLVTTVAVLVGAGAVVWIRAGRNGEAAEPQWRTATVTRGDLTVSVTGSGSVAPASEVEVKSRATGVVEAVYVSEGDRVTKNQVLVRLSDPDAAAAVSQAEASLRAAQARLAQAEATRRSQGTQDARQVDQAAASLEEAQARLRLLLAGARSEEVAQAEARVRSAQANLELARRNDARAQQLLGQGFIARQEADQAEAQLRAAEAEQRIAVEALGLLRAGPSAAEVDQARASVRQAQAALQQARAGLLEDSVRAQQVAEAGAQVAQAQTALANARERLAETQIRAPVAGLVSDRSVEVGQSVIGSSTGGTPVLKIAVIEPLLAKVMVDESDIPSVRPGLQAVVHADSLPEQEFKAKVRAVSPSSQVVNNVVQYEVTLVVEDPQDDLRLGMTVDADLVLMQRRGVLLVPRQAVRGEETNAVFVVEEHKLTSRTVKTGSTDGRMVEITSGLQEGEVVYLGDAQAGTSPNPQATPRNPFAPQFQRRVPASPRGTNP